MDDDWDFNIGCDWDIGFDLEEYPDPSLEEHRLKKRDRPPCGARCRDGHSCKAKPVANKITGEIINGRCRMHGGLSSGTKTTQGKERAREASRLGMLNYWKKKKACKNEQLIEERPIKFI